MKVFTTTGFYGTGSSAITDIIRECPSIACKSNFEVRFLHDPDGISDLEYNLIDNPNRHNTSHSIKRFKRAMERIDHIGPIKRYEKYFEGQFLPLTYEYIKSITELEYYGAWHYDVYERGNLFYLISRTYAKINSMLHKLFGVPLDGRALIPKSEKAYLGVKDRSCFIAATQKYVMNVLGILNNENKEIVFVDQLVPPSNFGRYCRYVPNLKIVITERDPRDIYLLEKVIWRGTVVPTDSVEDFCIWYRWTRNILGEIDGLDYVLKINFEDLIYSYEESIKKILDYYGISYSEHQFPRKYFNPQESIKNTQLWKNIAGYEKDISYIEENLSEFCYEFPYENKAEWEKKEMF